MHFGNKKYALKNELFYVTAYVSWPISNCLLKSFYIYRTCASTYNLGLCATSEKVGKHHIYINYLKISVQYLYVYTFMYNTYIRFLSTQINKLNVFYHTTLFQVFIGYGNMVFDIRLLLIGTLVIFINIM